jgi:hypothetical protein
VLPDDGRGTLAPTPAALFDLLWAAMVDVLGAAATAALVHRALKRTRLRAPELEALVIRSDGLDYGYTTPAPWSAPSTATPVSPGTPRTPAALLLLAEELCTLLEALTGPLVVRRLAQIPALRSAGVLPERVHA